MEARYAKFQARSPAEKREFFVTTACYVLCGAVAIYCIGPRPLLSQEGRRNAKKKQETIFDCIRQSRVKALFVYDSLNGTIESDNYFGRFVGNRQLGTAWDYMSKEWVNCYRRIVGVQIDDTFISTPRAILRGLVQGDLAILPSDIITIHPDGNIPLESQSGVRANNRRGASSEVWPDKNVGSSISTLSTLYVDAAGHHSNRMRVRHTPKIGLNGFNMANTFYDTKTVKNDVRLLQVRFNEAQRDHFAANGVAPRAVQVQGLAQTMREMKISVPGRDGSKQEVVQQVPIESPDDTDIGA